MYGRTPSIARDGNGQYTFYCRQCGKIQKSADWPDHCTWCGNTLDVDGFGVSGDNAVSNTTTTKSYTASPNLTRITTVDKKIG